MSLDDHAQAFLGRLGSSGSPALNVHDGKVPNGTDPDSDPYVLVYFTVFTPDGEQAPDKVNLTMLSDVIQMSAYCHCVGGGASAARAIAGRVRSALLNFTPTVSGRVCFPIKHVDNVQVDPDETTGSPVFELVDVYQLTTLPA